MFFGGERGMFSGEVEKKKRPGGGGRRRRELPPHAPPISKPKRREKRERGRSHDMGARGRNGAKTQN